MIYRAYGLGLSSEFALAGPAPAAPGTTVNLTVRSTSASVPEIDATDGLVTIAFDDIATFVVDPAALVVTCHAGTSDEATISHLLLDYVLPRWLAGTDLAVLHASGVLVSGEVVAFSAPSGGGKSTLAAQLGVAGFPIVSDDGLVVRSSGEAVEALPSYPALRLAGDVIALFGDEMRTEPLGEATAKRRVVSAPGLRFALDAAPVRAVALLARTAAEELSCSRLRGGAAVDAILRCLFSPLDAEEPHKLFSAAATIADRVTVVEITTPQASPARAVLDAVLAECM